MVELDGTFIRPGFALRFNYPMMTPEGRVVDRREEDRENAVRIHITSPGSGEVYVEVMKLSDLTPQEEYARHRPYLEERFGADAVTPFAETRFQSRPAWTYAFRWDEGERSVLSLGIGRDTYRIIHDPCSALNAEIITTITIP